MIAPDWPAPAGVRAFVTTRAFGDLKNDATRDKLATLLPAPPAWPKQVHGKTVIEPPGAGQADAVIARRPGVVCAIQIADCLPVLFADEAGATVAAAHAGWRGLAAGVLEATVEAMRVPPNRLLAWLGPAIGPRVYEVGEDVREALAGYDYAFRPNRPGHWLMDLHAIARRKLAPLKSVSGGGYCTFSDADRFFSYRRDRTTSRMGALIWLA